MSPLAIEIMLHYFYSDSAFPKEDTRAAISAVGDMRNAGMLEFSTPKQHDIITDRGRAYVQFLCSVPMPIKQERWTIQMENEPPWLNQVSQQDS